MSITYKSLKAAEREIREISSEVKSLSNGDFKIALKTSESMMILFTSEVSSPDIKARMKGLAFGEAYYLLFSVNGLLAGFADAHIIEWLGNRLRAK